jgi:integrase
LVELMTSDTLSPMSFQAAMDRYLSEVSSQLSPSSQARHERLVRMLIKGLGGERPLGSITPLLLSDYREKRLKNASAGTVEKDFLFLSELFERALSHWQVDFEGNPVNNLGSTARTHSRDRRLRPGEQVRLLAACDQYSNPMLGWVVRLALETAIRKSELLALKREHVDLENRTVTIPKTQTKAPRPVPLSQVAVQTLQEVFAQKNVPEDTSLLFYGELGRYETRRPYAVDRTFRKILMIARMKAFRFSDLRFEAISRLEDAGFSELEIVAIAGTRAIRGRRDPQQQPAALVTRLDALGVGVLSADHPVARRKNPPGKRAKEPELEEKKGRRGGGRASFGITVGINQP